MNIQQVTKADYETRLVPWYAKAINDPVVNRFLGLGSWREVPTAEDSDWAGAKFMDLNNLGLLSVSLQRENATANLGLWVLGRQQTLAASFMRFAILNVPKRYGIKYLAFCVAQSNEDWLASVMRIAAPWMWGKEPAGGHDMLTGERVDVLHFKVPVEAIRRRQR